MLVIKSNIPQIFVIHGQVVISNPLQGKAYRIRAQNSLFFDLLNVLRSLAKSPIEFNTLKTSCNDILKFSYSEIKSTLEVFIQMGILIDICQLTEGDKLIVKYPKLHDVFYFLSLSHSLTFADYSNKNVNIIDQSLMNEYFAESTPPPRYKQVVDSINFIKLPNNFSTNNLKNSITKLSAVLYFCFGSISEFEIMGIKSLLKALPSHGARHPFESYLVSNNSRLLPDGFFHYNSKDHFLEQIQIPSKAIFNNQGLYLIVCVIFDRVSWRYRNSWHYNDIFFDLGHIVGQLNYLKKKIGIDVCNFNATFNLPLFKDLLEEPIVIIKLEKL